MIETNKIYNEDNATGFERIDDNSVDVILEDPPYLYLKGHKLDRPFNEQRHFEQCRRILKPSGFIVLFGRGASFYRWNTILADLGFTFKEEIVWHKAYTSSPLNSISRIHETVAIFSKKNNPIKKVKVAYLDAREHNLDGIISDIKRLRAILSNDAELHAVQRYLSDGAIHTQDCDIKESTVTISSRKLKQASRCVTALRSINEGVRESSIIRAVPEKFTAIHPTQKPIRLLERLLALVSRPGDLVVDGFSGSASTAIAAYNTARRFVGFEIDKEYYDLSIERLNKVTQ